MTNFPNISPADQVTLGAGGMTFAQAEVLCRMSAFAYAETELEIKTALGAAQWSQIICWLDENVANQGFVAITDQLLVLAFRGTNARNDWERNAQAFFPQPHPLGGARHNGFQSVWQETPGPVRQLLKDAVAAGKTVWITGHSLGGAVATAASAEILSETPPGAANHRVMTFGAPRFGNIEFHNVYDARHASTHWFVANQRDPVPHLPPTFIKYRHAGLLRYFSDTGEFLDITKDQAGLQAADSTPEGQASEHWRHVEDDMGDRARDQQRYEAFVKGLSASLPQVEVTVAPGASAITTVDGSLQGNSLWTTSAHSIALYWQRLKAMLAN